MNKIKPKYDISVWLLLTAAVFIVVFFLWYFFIYVSGQEKLQVQKDFRALTQIGDNFKSRYESYISIIKSEYLQKKLSEETNGLADSISMLKDQKEALNEIRSNFRSTLEDIFKFKNDINKSDSLYKSLNILQETMERFKKIRKKYGFIDSVGKQQAYDQVNAEIREDFAGLELAENRLDNNYIYFGGRHYLSDTTGLPTSEQVFYRMKKSTFFIPIERKDTFGEFLVIKRDTKNKLFYSSFPGDLEVNTLDSLIKSPGEVVAGAVTDAKISGIDYKIFLTSLDLENGEKYFIGGLINKDNYVKEIRSINYFLVLIIVIVFIIFLLSIPLFKIKMTGESQQFKIPDLVLSTLSIILGTSFVVLVILSTLGYFRTMNNVDSSLKDLSNKIKNNFIDEINRIDRTLDQFIAKSLIVKGKFYNSKHPQIKFNNSNSIRLSDFSYVGFKNSIYYRLDDTNYANNKDKFNPDGVLFIRSNDTNFVRYTISDSSYLKSPNNAQLNDSAYIRLNDSAYNFFKLIFMLNKKGDQDKTIISSRQTEERPENYSYRDYFKKSGEWELNGKKIMIDFIYSSTSGEQLGVVSKRQKDKVYVITSRLYSVINTIMPPGYGFCIIDKKGDVKFDSDPEKMLRENFLTETKNSGQLLSAIYGNEETLFSGKYLGKSHSFYIQPIKNLPLYLVTYYDNTYSNSLNTQVTSNVVLFSVALLIMFFIILLGFRLIHYKKSGLKRRFDIVKFLKPDKYKSPFYFGMIASNIVATILIIISYFLANPVTIIYLVYLCVVIQLIAVYFRTEYEIRKEFTDKANSYRYLVFAGIIIIIIYYLAFKVSADIVYLTGFAVILLSADYYILIKRELIPSKKFRFYIDKSDPKLFYTYLFSWLCLIAVIPIIVFYIIFYNYETELDLAHSLYSYAEDETVRTYDIDKFYNDNMKRSFNFFRTVREKEGIYLLKHIQRYRHNADISLINDQSNYRTNDTTNKFLLDTLKIYASKDNITLPVNSLNNMIIYYKAGIDPLSRERRSLVQRDTNGIFIEPSGEVFLKYRMRQIHYSAAKNSPNVYYLGKAYGFGFDKPEIFILSVVAILAILFIMWKLIKFISDKMFGFSIKEERKFEDLLNYHKELGNNIIIYPSASSEDFINTIKLDPMSSVFDYGTSEPEKYSRKNMNSSNVIVQNLDINFEKPEKDSEKLSEINTLGKIPGTQLFLLFNRGIEKLIELTKAKIKSEKFNYKLGSLKKLLALLESMHKNYDHVYSPLIGAENRQIKDMLDRLPEDTRKKYGNLSEEIKRVIITELTVLGLPDKTIGKYAEQIITYANQNAESDTVCEKIVLKVQETAKSYYESIWSSCTNEEKLVLDDMSENLLLNSENRRIIMILMAKGLLKKDVSIDMVNKSFRNFVNTKKESESEKEYLGVRKAGNWAKYRAPLLLILAAIAFFIVLQENVFPNIYSMLTVILGIITAIGKISGLFGSGGASKAADTASG